MKPDYLQKIHLQSTVKVVVGDPVLSNHDALIYIVQNILFMTDILLEKECGCLKEMLKQRNTSR